MTKHTTKDALLGAIGDERADLEASYANLSPDEMTRADAMDDWSVKDILAHLTDWEQRLLDWYAMGVRGEKPQLPAPGMTWGDLAKLNRQGYERHRDQSLAAVLAESRDSYGQVLALVEGMPEEEIFAPGRYAWTGKRGLATYIAANTCEHYAWARKQIATATRRRARAAKSKAGES